MQSTSLRQVVKVDNDKCLNCHACITACPVKYCNNGSGDVVEVNADMCIACGKCIEACTHDARYYVDDFQKFIDDIIAGEKIIAIAAPAVAAGFPDLYLNLNGWLKELGIEAIFDVSFGAELTVKSYLEHIKKNNPKTVIAQPCAAIVTYIELYKPELIQYLAPVDSPMLHTAKMVKRFYPQYKNHKIAVISPCNAKRHEFDETGIGDYNIAHQSIDKFLKDNKLKLSSFAKVDFDNPSAERAVNFSSPGGLLYTAERWMPGISEKARKIEGNPLVYDYFNTLPNIIEQGKAPLIIDCLSCEFGCNAGPLTLTKGLPQDEIEYRIKKRSDKLKEKYLSENENNPKLNTQQIEKVINKYWEDGLYTRTYVNRWKNVNLKYPNDKEKKKIYKLMHKYHDDDIKNCSSCGYASCEGMAVAIFNKLNKVENCHFYLSKETELSNEKTQESKIRLSKILDTALDGFVETDKNEIIRDANPAMQKILKRADLIGRSLYEFMDEDNLAIFASQNLERERGKLASYEIKFTQSDGKKIYGLVSATPLTNINGKIIGSFAMISDITKLKVTENELKLINEELELRVLDRTMELDEAVEELRTNAEIIESYNEELERLSIVASETDNSIIIMDAKGNFEWINDAYQKLYGITSEELKLLIGKNIVDVSSYGNIDEVLKSVISTKKSATYNSETVNSNRDKIYSQTTLSPVLKDTGDIRNIVLVDSDITDLKESEKQILNQNEEILQQREELLTQRDALQESGEHVKNIIASLPDAAFVIDDNGFVVYWNKAIEGLTGVKAENIIGLGNYEYALPFYNERKPILIDLVTKEIEILEKEYKNIVVKGNVIQAEAYTKDSKGEERYISATATALYDLSGKYKGAIEIMHDITQRKKEQEALLKQKAEIENQNSRITKQATEIKDSINYAAKIQQAILPSEEEIVKVLPNHFIFYKPKDIVGGDYYWIDEVNNKTIVAAVDCTGHGVPGGFMSMLGVSLMNEIILEKKICSPDEILNSLRKLIIDSLRQATGENRNRDGMDMSICVIDKENGIVEFASANNPIYILRNNEVIIIKGDRMPIGKHRRDNTPFAKQTFKIEKNDTIYLFSDGFVDQIGITGRKFLAKNFRDVLLKIHQNDLTTQKQLLEELYTTWKGDYQQIDDILIIGVRI